MAKGLRCCVCLLMRTVYLLLLKDFCENIFVNQFLFGSLIFFSLIFFKFNFNDKKNALKTTSPTVLVPWLQSPTGFRIPFEFSQSKTSVPFSPSAPPWPWPPCWPGGYWGRPGPGPGPHIYFIVWTFQRGRAAADTEKVNICLLKTCIVC